MSRPLLGWRRRRLEPQRTAADEPALPSVPEPAPPSSWAEEIAALPLPVAPGPEPAGGRARTIVVGSGKGGVGKTLVSSSLAIGLGATGVGPIVAIDVDLGGANLHTGLGIPRPVFGLSRFLLDGTPLRDLAATTEWPGVRFVGGASDIVGLAELDAEARERFHRELGALPSEWILLDLGAGSSRFNLDLFSLADEAVLVTTPETTAVQNAYGFLRAALYRRLRTIVEDRPAVARLLDDAMNHRSDDAASLPELVRTVRTVDPDASGRMGGVLGTVRLRLVVNMSGPEQGAAVAARLARVVRRYLGARLDYMGNVDRDDAVVRAVAASRPLVAALPESRAARDLRRIVARMAERLDARRLAGASAAG